MTCESPQPSPGEVCPPADNGCAQAGSFLSDKQGRESIVFLEQPRKEREESPSSPLFMKWPAPGPCSFIPRVSPRGGW